MFPNFVTDDASDLLVTNSFVDLGGDEIAFCCHIPHCRYILRHALILSLQTTGELCAQKNFTNWLIKMLLEPYNGILLRFSEVSFRCERAV
jgi:hypothetical protein